MRIAQVSPLIESVPPKLYGGTERVIFWLTEELIKQGHEVTLFASGDSQTSAKLVPGSKAALRFDESVLQPLPYYFAMLEELRRRASEFDIIHFHLDYLHFPQFSDIATRTLTTQHGRLDLPDLPTVLTPSADAAGLISIINASPCPPPTGSRPSIMACPQGCIASIQTASAITFAFLGRICHDKRLIERSKSPSGPVFSEDRREGRQGRPRLLRGQDPTTARRSACGVHRRNQRARKDRLPFRRQGTSFPNRLAGAFWIGDDRGDGLRDAGNCLALWLRAGNH